MTPCRVLPKPLDVPDQQTSLVRFLIEELGVPHIAITTIQHDSQPVNLPPFPLLPHRDSNQQNPAPQIVKCIVCYWFYVPHWEKSMEMVPEFVVVKLLVHLCLSSDEDICINSIVVKGASYTIGFMFHTGRNPWKWFGNSWW
ncbi:hypothetical protein AVEN_243452-1 [Araneus ventricosus]|uniref:Uncharacterized protein n=1 Tax=Araneus ventricosus TaxID=182803 RepID=A0A4Y2QCU7_ARAVE|nr:hypothetical protein AVEN_243452-1 [Araneus ventricosus]